MSVSVSVRNVSEKCQWELLPLRMTVMQSISLSEIFAIYWQKCELCLCNGELEMFSLLKISLIHCCYCVVDYCETLLSVVWNIQYIECYVSFPPYHINTLLPKVRTLVIDCVLPCFWPLLPMSFDRNSFKKSISQT
jgi:hypothetical protein